jgi:DNA replication protein DnaC
MNAGSGQAERPSVVERSWDFPLTKGTQDGSHEATEEKTSRRSSFEIRVRASGDGSYARLLAKLAKFDLLAIDDWLLASLTDPERRDLLEVIEDRSERKSTLVASQLPPTAWHAAIGEPSVADAICDRLIHCAHRLTLKGPTMRDPATRRGSKASS